MNIRIDKSFEKDTDKILDAYLLNKLAAVIDEIKKCNRQDEIRNIRKMKGGGRFYRIRIGDYRIGITIRFLNRKDIYKYFP